METAHCDTYKIEEIFGSIGNFNKLLNPDGDEKTDNSELLDSEKLLKIKPFKDFIANGLIDRISRDALARRIKEEYLSQLNQ